MAHTETDRTVVMHPAAFAHTVVASGGVDGLPVVATVTPTLGTASLVRTTVLPRVDMAAGGGQIVLEAKERYADERLLGEGGVGEVVRAEDNDIARPVAIKRLKSHMKTQSTVLRFVEEIRTIGQLEHPNIVPIHDVGVDARGDYFFVMKYVEGETLESIIDKLAAGDPLYHRIYTVDQRVRIFMSILDAIAHAHEKGFVHRDIKPANVMVGTHGQVVVMDWGLAKRVAGVDHARSYAAGLAGSAELAAPSARVSKRFHETVAGSLLGTPAYMSPEQARGEEATEKSDIYSLCVLFYELLALRHYLADDCTTLATLLDAVQHRDAPAASFVKSPHQRRTPMDLSWFLRAGLEKDPAKRFDSVQAMTHRLELRAQGIVPIQCHITFAKRMGGMTMRAIDRYPYQVTAAMAVGVLGSLAGFGWLVKAALTGGVG